MRAAELYLLYRKKQRELAAATQSSAQVRAAIAVLASELERDIAILDQSGQTWLCQDLAVQLEQDLNYAGGGRRREVLTRLLKAIEDIEHRHGLR